MPATYALFWTPIPADRRAAHPSDRDMPSEFLTEQDALTAAYRALSLGFSVDRIDCPDGALIPREEIEARYRMPARA